MRREVLLFALVAALAVTTNARATTTWMGASIAFPMPGHDAARDQLGLDAGMTLHHDANPHFGVGLDIAYHYFPTSAAYMAGIDRYLRLRQSAVIDAPTYAFKAIQVTPHLRVSEPMGEHWVAWGQVGGGAYLVDRNLGPTDWTGSLYSYNGRGFTKYAPEPGWNAGLGLDSHPSHGITIGINASYHQIVSEHEVNGSSLQLPTFNVITAGLHVLFGW